jgi:hypothetical protein
MTGSGNSRFSRTMGFARVAERVAGAGVLDADAADDVAGVDDVEVVIARWRASRGDDRRAPSPWCACCDLLALVELPEYTRK